MRTVGILVLVLGLVLVVTGIGMFVGGIFTFQSSVKSALESRVAATLPLTVDQTAKSEPITVNPEKKCQIVFQADLSGTDVKKSSHGDETDYQLDYNLPFECEVFDETGKSIHRESSSLSGSGFTIHVNRNVDEDGGTETPRLMLGTFEAPDSGKLTVTAKVGKNVGGDIEVLEAQVDVLDNVSDSGAAAAGGMGMCCGGPAVSIFGLLLLVVGAIISLTARSGSAPRMAAPPETFGPR